MVLGGPKWRGSLLEVLDRGAAESLGLHGRRHVPNLPRASKPVETSSAGFAASRGTANSTASTTSTASTASTTSTWRIRLFSK